MYRLKNFHLFVKGVKVFDVLKNYRYNVCDAFKMIKIINKKSRIKIIISKIKIYIDFIELYSINSIIDKYKMFIMFINKIIDYVEIKLFVSKSEVKKFLIYNYRSFIMKNYRLILFIRTNNVKKYIVIKNELQNMSVIIKFIIVYY